MAEPNTKSEKPKTGYKSLEVVTQEFNDYLKRTGVSECLTNVLKLLYEMKEKPVDPLEFMRVNMTEFIPEREELVRLQEEHDKVMQQIAAFQRENSFLERKLQSTLEGNLTIEEAIFSTLSNDDVGKENSTM